METLYCVIGQGWMEDETENTTACNFVSEKQSACRDVARKIAEVNVEQLRDLEIDVPEGHRTNFGIVEHSPDRLIVMDLDTDTWHSSFEVQEVADNDLPQTDMVQDLGDLDNLSVDDEGKVVKWNEAYEESGRDLAELAPDAYEAEVAAHLHDIGGSWRQALAIFQHNDNSGGWMYGDVASYIKHKIANGEE